MANTILVSETFKASLVYAKMTYTTEIQCEAYINGGILYVELYQGSRFVDEYNTVFSVTYNGITHTGTISNVPQTVTLSFDYLNGLNTFALSGSAALALGNTKLYFDQDSSKTSKIFTFENVSSVYSAVNIDEVWKESDEEYVNISTVLPDGYTRVEYIESSGTQYIDTDFIPNQDTRVVMDFDLISAYSTYAWITLFASRNGNANTFGTFSNSALTITYDTYASANGNRSVSLRGRHIVDKNKNETFVDGTSIGAFSYVLFTGTVQLRLLRDNQPNGGDVHPFVGKLYSCKIYDNGTLVRNFIPCINSAGTAGLYDIVNGRFYTNAGTGTFSTGGTVNAGGVWHEVIHEYANINGVWKETY